MYSFYARRSQMRKKRLSSQQCHGAFGTYECKSCTLNVGEIDTWSIQRRTLIGLEWLSRVVKNLTITPLKKRPIQRMRDAKIVKQIFKSLSKFKRNGILFLYWKSMAVSSARKNETFSVLVIIIIFINLSLYWLFYHWIIFSLELPQMDSLTLLCFDNELFWCYASTVLTWIQN